MHQHENKVAALDLILLLKKSKLPLVGKMTPPDTLLFGLPLAYSMTLGIVIGLVIGSYLATTYARWPRSQRTSGATRSACDTCHRKLRWYELVPVISWLTLRGRCLRCHAPIPGVYSAIEALCAILGAATFAMGQPTLAPFVWMLVALAFFDARLLWLPNRLVAALALAALLAPMPEPSVSLTWRLAAGVGAAAGLWLIAASYRRWRGRNGLGGGDIKLLGAIGLWCGPMHLPAIVLLACGTGLADAAGRVARGADARTLRLPLGTYLAGATILLAVVKPIGVRVIEWA
ncbi:MAG: prepilin peptidase [Croceibacterium sp.]